MGDQFWLMGEPAERMRARCPKVRGKARSDDRGVLSGIIHVTRNGLRWRDAPAVYGPHKTLYNRFVRRSRLGVFARAFGDLARPGGEGDTITRVQHPPQGPPHGGPSLSKGGARPRAIGRTEGGLSSKPHRVGDGRGRPPTVFLSPGRMSDARGALALLAELPAAKRILGDRGCDADRLRDEPKGRGLRICIPARRGRRSPASHNRGLHRTSHRIENAFSRLKDWRGIATRHARRSDLLPSATCRAATVIFWLPL